MKILDNHKVIRTNFENVCDSVSAEELITIPKGFNNHILWNYGHAIATQNVLIYKMCNLPFTLPEEFIENYKKGSFPVAVDEPKKAFYEMIALAEKAMEQLNADIRNMIFDEYEPYQTSFGIKLNSFNDALQFNNIHEGLHLGYAMAIRKALGK